MSGLESRLRSRLQKGWARDPMSMRGARMDGERRVEGLMTVSAGVSCAGKLDSPPSLRISRRLDDMFLW